MALLVYVDDLMATIQIYVHLLRNTKINVFILKTLVS